MLSSVAQFKEISFAHEVLTNPKKREIYDNYGLKGLQEGIQDGESLFHAEDIFSHVFGGGLFGMGGGSRNRKQKTDDIVQHFK